MRNVGNRNQIFQETIKGADKVDNNKNLGSNTDNNNNSIVYTPVVNQNNTQATDNSQCLK